MNLYLIGYRCSGKTTLGRALALRLGWQFQDMDDVIVAQSGLTITRIVERWGWPTFRQKERELIARIAQLDRQVVGTGGGIVLDADNTAAMRRSGRVVWLRSRPETLRRWIQADRRTPDLRPALTEKGLLDEIEETLAAREPLYRTAMHVVVDTDDFQVEALCDRILDQLKTLDANAFEAS